MRGKARGRVKSGTSRSIIGTPRLESRPPFPALTAPVAQRDDDVDRSGANDVLWPAFVNRRPGNTMPTIPETPARFKDEREIAGNRHRCGAANPSDRSGAE